MSIDCRKIHTLHGAHKLLEVHSIGIHQKLTISHISPILLSQDCSKRTTHTVYDKTFKGEHFCGLPMTTCFRFLIMKQENYQW